MRAGVASESRVLTRSGPFVVRRDERGATVRLHIAMPAASSSYSLVLEAERASLRIRERVDGTAWCSSGPSSRRWCMTAPSVGSGFPGDVFVRASGFVDCACADLAEVETFVVLARIRHEANEAIRWAARAALRRCDPGALALARRMHPEARFLAYRQIVRDTSGRIAQLIDTCPGLLLLWAWAEDVPGTEGIVDAILAGVRKGTPLSRIVRTAVESVLDAGLAGDCVSNAAATLGRDRWVRNATLLVRRAAPVVHPRVIIAAAPLAFAPEDIPRRHAANAEWYSVMPALVRALAELPPDVASATSMFASRHVHVVAAAGKQLHPLGFTELGVLHGRVERIARSVAVYANETGRRPRRCSNSRRYIARARRWIVRERNGGSPLYRAGKLIERLRSLELGPVVGVRFLGEEAQWAEADEGLPFPEFPWTAVRVEGVDVTHITDARTLAAEGQDMDHCVASALAEVAAGELVLFSVRTATSRLTLALQPRHDGTYSIEELRAVSDRAPSLRERERVEQWVEAVNRCVHTHLGR